MGASSAFPALPGASAAQTQAQAASNVAVTPANLASRQSFFANKNAVAQGSIASATSTKLTFTNEVWDVGAAYDAANSRWTPTGYARISACIIVSTALTGISVLQLYKNGTLHLNGEYGNTLAANQSLAASWLVAGNGSDYYEIWAYITTAAGASVGGDIQATYFMGEQI